MPKDKGENGDALVTDAHERISLYAIRSLGRRGIRVGAISPRQNAIGFLSRYCKKKYSVKFEHLFRIAENYEVLLPISLQSIENILINSGKLKTILPPLPSLSSFRTSIRKDQLLEIAEENDIPTPRAYNVSEIEKAKFPLVIKYRVEVGLSPSERHVIVRNEKEFHVVYEKMNKTQVNPLIQEYIPGEGYGFFALYNYEGEQRAFFCHRRLREEFLSGGPSTYCESVYIPEIIEYGSRLLEVLDWKGLAMVEFRRDNRDGKYKLMEINPRIWGSMPLAIAAGVDFPYLWYKIAIEGDIKKLKEYRIGVRLRFLFRDLLSSYQQFNISKNKIKYLRDYLREVLGSSYEYGILSRDDPLPAIGELTSILKTIVVGVKKKWIR